MLTKYKNSIYKITPLGFLFPATITNNTGRVIITSRKISGTKKTILNYKWFEILAEIDLEKVPNWNETKGKSIWVNIQFCFPFKTKALSDLTSFTLQLQDDQNKKTEFASGEKKTCIFNFRIDVYVA